MTLRESAKSAVSSEDLADQVLAALTNLGAAGRQRARTQAEIARVVGCPQRLICDATLALNLRGEPAISTCGSPPGVFLAQTVEELQGYEQQLDHRIRGNAIRLREVRKILRKKIAQAAVEPSGQRRLSFA
jgi:hypothetical protein